MFPEFFKNKMREVGSFLRIMRGKATGNDQERARGVDDAMDALKAERETYQKERKEASRGVDSDLSTKQEKVLRESGGQDISAI